MKKLLFRLVLPFTVFILDIVSSQAQVKFTAISGRTINAAGIDAFVHTQMDSLHMPGLSIAFIDRGKIVYHRVFGVTNIDTRQPVDDQSIFEAASLSKTVFAYFVLRLVDKGILNLDTPLYRYLPYPDIAYDDRYKLITARMVLCHRTGFPNWRGADMTSTDLHRKRGDLYLQFTPGTRYSYSGEGYYYLSLVVAHLTHRTLQNLEALYEKEVAVPLGMEHAWYTDNAYIRLHKVPGYVNGKVHIHHRAGWPNPFDWVDSSWFGSAYGLHTEAVGYAHFLIGLMHGEGLSKKSFRDMFTAQSRIPPTNENYEDTAYGFGIGMQSIGHHTFYEHGGNNGNFQSSFVINKSLQNGYVFFTNCDQGHAFYIKLMDFLLGDEAVHKVVVNGQNYPHSTWDTLPHPEQLGWNTAKLDTVLRRFIIDSTQYTGFMIIQKGKEVFEYGDLPENSYIASCRKSVLSMLYGAHIRSGEIDLDKSLQDLHIDDIGGLLPVEKEATVGDIISARSGVFHPASYPGDYLSLAPKRGSVKHGEYWLYSNWDFNLAGYIFEKQTHRNIYDEVDSVLAGPLHMQDWNRSLQIKEGDSTLSIYKAYPMWFSTRDMARIGLLMLNKGKWGDQQIIDERWIDAILTPRTSFTEVDAHIPTFRNTDYHFDYGCMWWLWHYPQDDRFTGAYSAVGAIGQTITVLPAIDVVIVGKTKDIYERHTHHEALYRSLIMAADCYTPPR